MVSADLLSGDCVGSAGAALPFLKCTGEHLGGRVAGYPLHSSSVTWRPASTLLQWTLPWRAGCMTIWARQQQHVV